MLKNRAVSLTLEENILLVASYSPDKGFCFKYFGRKNKTKLLCVIVLHRYKIGAGENVQKKMVKSKSNNGVVCFCTFSFRTLRRF